MKIRELRLVNFRNHENTSIPLERVNIFVGDNGSGKSSIRAAVEYLLTGRCFWTDRRGAGAENLIRHGEKQAVIEAKVDGLGKIVRTIPNSLAIEGWQGNLTSLQAALYNHLGASEEIISAVLNTTEFVDLSPAEQKAMLFRLMGLNFDREKVTATLKEWAGAHWSENLGNTFAAYCPREISGGAEVFDQLDKTFREVRKAAKKTLKELETILSTSTLPPLPQGFTPNDWEAVESQLKELKKRRDQLVAEQANAAMMSDRRQKAEAQVNNLRSLVEATKRELADLKVDRQRIKALEKGIAALEDELQKLLVREQELKAQTNRLAGEVSVLERTIAAVEEAGGACLVAPGVLSCPMTDADRETIVKKLRADLEAKKKELQRITSVISDLNTAVMGQELILKKDELARLREAAAKKEAIERSLAENEKLLAGMEADLLPISDGEAIAKELAEVTARIAKGEEIQTALSVYAQASEQQAQLRKRVEAQVAEVEALEILVEAFGPKGIKQQILAQVVRPVEEQARTRLAELTGGEFSLAFSLDPDFEILVTHHGVTTPLRLLSTSEKMRVGIVLQDVLNSLTGLGVMIIDDTEILDPGNKVRLINTLLAMDHYDTIILLAARGETEPEDPGIPGLAMFIVEDGQVKRLERSRAKIA